MEILTESQLLELSHSLRAAAAMLEDRAEFSDAALLAVASSKVDELARMLEREA